MNVFLLQEDGSNGIKRGDKEIKSDEAESYSKSIKNSHMGIVDLAISKALPPSQTTESK